METKDRNLIYLLVTILIIVLIIAIGVIVFMGMKMMDMQKENSKNVAKIQQAGKMQSIDVQAEIQRAVKEQINRIKPNDNSSQQSGKNIAKEDIATIVKMVMSQMEQKPPVNREEGDNETQTLSAINSELKKVVDGDFGEDSQSGRTKNSSLDNVEDESENILDILRSIDVDEVDDKIEDENISLDSLDLDNIEAKEVKKKENSDTFNKVVIEMNDTGGELAKIGNEIDKLVEKNSKNIKESEYEKQMKKEIKERRNEMRIIVVRRGDTLSEIAKRAYGSGKEIYYKKILKANPRLIKNPNRIFVGQKLRVPR